ncbi:MULTISPECIES: 1-(5-phosphoribosyl)-5-[(5-phosphoribosylamino)methylideneamino]imidazole-4-carboxamide isomerase [unclassified Oceanispirochaeta]|uniref:1-(5-phosphoribosyl)-5-[(5- phosphoribosylamino)methylideneamino]imidazole-4- carboxamide isomerase n=1 Tax=unclassified Oceanispirochaeta TaxID=2635722 RepID=UPI000E08D05E|nr:MULTISPECIES: 1-(5-phosphoribosyl)-5-[(5-phosphoribosylamino)methylideneamino]imidazole-4-carboxamide isomerase [unclassified Oceanispirochaeta]MBF9015272.1 1-(5-phosphoribosyl)-5-[(5-phosphoribosylamino)methylideneamino]imidazole-4-carboxamide isomerase [Oceanispirochaeta sp. M2]NPD71730.1 1-(5-phosphoribosyl)-5-[(5-phosphoribosylamino)methylideneamino]imidazole-4-carboxamide isomerase [Oceanispirochaeta sp. M1]RDG32923.1 1-(5-phosphoribosyl)-5-[(5-phosphoribosylamino)methylideneamino]imidaz
MVIIPAIDLLGGECVRLYKGDYNEVKSYESDPAVAARAFQKLGVKRLHLVDLDAARGEGKNNREALRKIRSVFSGILELGGGVRRDEDVKELLEIGVDKLIVGTILAKTPELVDQWIKSYGKVFIAGIDALDGEVKVSGWEKGTALKDSDLGKKCASMGIENIIYTNIDRDGTLAGPDLESTNRMARETGLLITLSGGISSQDDMKNVCDNGDPLVKGIITGKAYYEGRIDLEKALSDFQKEDEEYNW